MEIAFQQSLFGKTSSELGYQETGWIISPYCERSRAPKFQCLLLDSGQMPEWCEGDDVISPGASWTPNIGQTPELHAGKESFSWQIFTGQRAGEILFKSRPLFQNFNLCSAGGVSAAEADRGDFIEAGRRIPIVQPFSGLRMRGGAKHHDQRMFLRSFGKRTDPFPTLLASELYPFAFWYEDDPSSGCIRFLTETECERLMGLPEGWTKYGADGREICSTNRYTALGNAIALPCAEYIMAGIADALGK